MNKTAHVYAIRNSKSGDCYVGCTIQLAARWVRHHYLLRAGKHHSARLQDAWNADADAFEFVVLEIIPDSTKVLRRVREAHWSRQCGGYNTMPWQPDSTRMTIRPEDREKRSRATLDAIAADPEFREFLSKRGQALADAIRSTEGRDSAARALERRWRDPAQRQALLGGLIRRWANPEAHTRQSEAMKRARSTPEARAAHAEALRRAWDDPNSGLRNRADGRWNDPEARERQAAKMRAYHAARRAAKP